MMEAWRLSVPGWTAASETHFRWRAETRFLFSHSLPRWKKDLPYRYVLRSGTVQERTATIGVSEREYRWRWFMWLPRPRMVKRTIDQVGERSGSWKGGCLGCSYELRPGETPDDCLRRMERERKFSWRFLIPIQTKSALVGT
jgi:hypothetical protein